mmetsp:Transcript_14259/g.41850  ORF Transcript_14259/g.41850 Transcript_14259/m.41850 type:complete len:341 (-) Transcript_14259:133-1155(-)
MLASLAGFFLVMACFGCLLMCAHSGWIHIEHNVIYIGPRPPSPDGEAGDTAPILLTEGQVLSLPEVEYSPPWQHFGETTSGLGGGGGDGGRAPMEDAARMRQCRGGGSMGGDDETAIDDNGREHDPAESLLSPLPPSLLDRTLSINCNTACSICLEDYERGERVRVLPCDHIFHTECIVPWLTERAPCCPLCKGGIVAEGGDGHEGRSEPSSAGHEVGFGGGASEGAPSEASSDVERGERASRGLGWGGSILSMLSSSETSVERIPFLSRILGARAPSQHFGHEEQREERGVEGLRTPLLRNQRSPPVSRRPSSGSGSGASTASSSRIISSRSQRRNVDD